MAFPTGWTRYCPLVIQHSKVPANQTGFPVLITAACLPAEMVTSGGSNAAQSDGGDIRFSSDAAGTTQLPCEIVVWTQNASPASAAAEIWVPVDILAASDVTIYVWYSAGGGQSQPAPGAAFGAYSVWTTNAVYSAVYHFPNGTTLTANSSNNAANVGTITACTATAGKIDGAASFNGSTTRIDLGSNLNVSTSLSWECWMNPSSFPHADNVILSEDETVLGEKKFQLWVVTSGQIGAYTVNGSTGAFISAGSTTFTVTGTWYHLAVTYSISTGLILYVNGVAEGTAAANGNLNSAPVKTLVGDSTNAGKRFAGAIDEVRTCPTVLSAAWIATNYHNQSSPATFIIAGTPSGIGGGTSTTVSATCSIAISPAYGTLTGIWLDLWVWRQLWHLDALTDTVSFLPVYRRALVMGLARELCREYGRDPAVVEQQANQAMEELESSNQSIRTEGVKDLEQS